MKYGREDLTKEIMINALRSKKLNMKIEKQENLYGEGFINSVRKPIKVKSVMFLLYQLIKPVKNGYLAAFFTCV